MEITIGNSPELIKKAQAIRYQVFMIEQQIPPELEIDGFDETSAHALVTERSTAIATARLAIKDDGSSVLARVAVVEEYRGRGIASKMVNSLMDYAKKAGVTSIKIHAHGYLQNYYEKFGFEFVQEVEIVGAHQLIEMQHQIARTNI
ncbi:GNAT family N-acetyltransferase [Vibrio sp. 404]|uniref:GNAT family N-acetyltransferase n=1 Tax=Vibrio marinisediminis TaxID=2758441 RepID=A0A7W2FRN8_9VIBR|nr:GNAT family N-acetyltransferase [Vibrio marinisediminis]MBA5763034.1 GNAT family N-acetyltransferase [Vibrio marinisediminis]